MREFEILKELELQRHCFHELILLLDTGEEITIGKSIMEVSPYHHPVNTEPKGEIRIRQGEFGAIEWAERYNSYVWLSYVQEVPIARLVNIKEILSITVTLFSHQQNIEVEGYFKSERVQVEVVYYNAKGEEGIDFENQTTFTLKKRVEQEKLSELIRKLSEKQVEVITNLAKELVDLREG